MEASHRPEIDNGHVPLAFLLGRRASEYSLPSLASHSVRRRKLSLGIPVLSDGTAHVRRREEHATQLLERVLAQESRLDPNQKYEPETPLEAPMARVSTADRRRRADELQRVLKEQEAVAMAIATAASADVSNANHVGEDELRSRLFDQRALYAATHGYMLREPDFVEVVGNAARIQRAQSVRQFHEDEKLKRSKLFKAKQSRRAAMTQQLQTQQAHMKAKLVQVERVVTRNNVQHDEEETETGGSNRRVAPVGSDAFRRQKQSTVKHWQDEQQRQLERTKENEKQQLQHRQELARRARLDTEWAVKARIASLQFEKKTMAKIKGVGPSFQSALRVEEATDGSPSSSTSISAPVLLLDAVTNGQRTRGKGDGEDPRRDREGERVSGHHLCARQYELFQKSQPRSVHLGGGFASKPRDISQAAAENDGQDELATRAHAVPLTKSKRQVQDEWRQMLVTLP